MDQEELKRFEDRALFDAQGYFDRIAKERPGLSPEAVAQLAVAAAIEFQTSVLRFAVEKPLERIEDLLSKNR